MTFKIHGLVAHKRKQVKIINEVFDTYDAASERLKELILKFDVNSLKIEFLD